MSKQTFDTNILINHFNRHRPLDGKSEKDAESWVQILTQDHDTKLILSPVEVEFLCGVVDEHEMRLREAFLRRFEVADDHRTLPEDWKEARRFAKHPGYQPRSRDLGDCLLLAIADRLNLRIITDDKGLKRQRGRTRQHRP
jgi:predicted nucleic acid-binding protein